MAGLQAWRHALQHHRRKLLRPALSLLRLYAASHRVGAQRASRALSRWRAATRDGSAERWERCERWLDEIEVATTSLLIYSRRGPQSAAGVPASCGHGAPPPPQSASADEPGSWTDARIAWALSRWRARGWSGGARRLRALHAARWHELRDAARAWAAWAALRRSRPLAARPPLWRRRSLARALGRRAARRALLAFRERAAHAAARRAAERARFATLRRAAARALATWHSHAARVVRALCSAWRLWCASRRPIARVRPLATLRAEIAAEVRAGMRSASCAPRSLENVQSGPARVSISPVEPPAHQPTPDRGHI